MYTAAVSPIDSKNSTLHEAVYLGCTAHLRPKRRWSLTARAQNIQRFQTRKRLIAEMGAAEDAQTAIGWLMLVIYGSVYMIVIPWFIKRRFVSLAPICANFAVFNGSVCCVQHRNIQPIRARAPMFVVFSSVCQFLQMVSISAQVRSFAVLAFAGGRGRRGVAHVLHITCMD